jgi:hypothetical protein
MQAAFFATCLGADEPSLRGIPLIHDEAVDEWGTKHKGRSLNDRANLPADCGVSIN